MNRCSLRSCSLLLLLTLLILPVFGIRAQEAPELQGWEMYLAADAEQEHAIIGALSEAGLGNVLSYSTAQVYFNTFTQVGLRPLREVAVLGTDDPRWTPYLSKLQNLFVHPASGVRRLFVPESVWPQANRIINRTLPRETRVSQPWNGWAPVMPGTSTPGGVPMVLLILGAAAGLWGFTGIGRPEPLLPLILLLPLSVVVGASGLLSLTAGAFWLGVWISGIEQGFSRGRASRSWWRSRHRSPGVFLVGLITRMSRMSLSSRVVPLWFPGLAGVLAGLVLAALGGAAQVLAVAAWILVTPGCLGAVYLLRFRMWQRREHRPFEYLRLVPDRGSWGRLLSGGGVVVLMVLGVILLSAPRGTDSSAEPELSGGQITLDQDEMVAHYFFQQWYLYGADYRAVTPGYTLTVPRFTLTDEGYEERTQEIDRFDDQWVVAAEGFIRSNPLMPGNLILQNGGSLRVVLPGMERVYSTGNLFRMWGLVWMTLLWLPMLWRIVRRLAEPSYRYRHGLAGQVRV